MAFVDLEKAFDRVPREVVWWALRVVGVDEWIVKAIQAMYVGVTTAVILRDEESKEFGVKVGVRQGSVLSPLLLLFSGSIIYRLQVRVPMGAALR